MLNFLNRVPKHFYVWMLSVFLFGLAIMTSFVFVQQEGRSSIDIPLIQMAQSAEVDLKSGAATSAILKAQQIDLSINQIPFITLYSLDKEIIGSSQHLNGNALKLPIGVLANAKEKGEVRVTWQPTSNLRFATITDYVPGFGYVSVAQSLQETEARANRGMWLALIALTLGSIASGAVIFYLARWRKVGVL